MKEFDQHEITGHADDSPKPAYVGNVLRATADHLQGLSRALKRADDMPHKRVQDALVISGDLSRTAEVLQRRTIQAALHRGDLSLREIAALTGLPKSNVHRLAHSAELTAGEPERAGEPQDAC